MASSSQPASGHLTEKEFLAVAEKIGNERLQLAINLGVSETTVNQIEQDHNTAVDCTFAVLTRWSHAVGNSCPPNEKTQQLVDALKKIGRCDIINMFENDLKTPKKSEEHLVGAFQDMHIAHKAEEILTAEDREKIRGAFYDLKTNMKTDDVITRMFTKKVLTQIQKEKLESLITESDKADYILTSVMKGSYGDLIALREALENSNQNHLAQKLPSA